MVKIRLQRTGSKNDPHYRIVAADSRSPRDGRFIELIGHYHPTLGGTHQFTINEEKANDWLKKGAQPTETVKGLFKKQGLLTKTVAKAS
ncbi:30S ribosomal protein S16 [Leptospira sp. GIMC2001]|uniref:30S ribosomal protein S16 n=1 Tax=Leptospira sp. GIMC2001 TaxID=1513297 RepID=UPI00234941A8|nr:30S ribosomal protein S16 [Leptospira sp. GIMC2001]WCL47920.1 30S ribosomal protein S16 [Leptospira sp. GIMC2001]